MIGYIIRRVLAMIPVLIGIIFITLILFYVVTSDPVLQYAGKNPTESTLQALRAQYQLDAPVFYSRDYLTGEDVLQARRADAVHDALGSLSAAHDDADAAPETILLRQWRNRTHITADEFEEFNRRWIAWHHGDETQAIPEPALSPSERRRISSRTLWDGQFFRVLRFDFANSMQYPDENIWDLIKRKGPVSLRITLPMFFIGLGLQLALSLFAARNRSRWPDIMITILAVLAMSIPFLSYIVFGQWFASATGWFPVSGYGPGIGDMYYLVFPVAIGIIAGLGGGVRFYRAVLVEETDREYVRTAKAKGVRERDILFVHVLRNAGIQIITQVSTVIPFLITGSLLIERSFEMPGLGDLMLSSINNRDFWVVMPLTYLLAIIYSVAVLITDIAYAMIDPRVRVTG